MLNMQCEIRVGIESVDRILASHGQIVFRFGIGLLLSTYALATWLGYRWGRRTEYANWEREITPQLKQMKNERDALWRSAVSKTQKLNRLRRGD